MRAVTRCAAFLPRAALLLFAAAAGCERADGSAPPDDLRDVTLVPVLGGDPDVVFLELTEVTNAQFARFLAESGYRRDEPDFLLHWRKRMARRGTGAEPRIGAPARPELPEDLAFHPVAHVNWVDARAYASWRRMRLPTEREWWAAVSSSGTGAYPWGFWQPLRANTLELGLGRTTPVGFFELGRSAFGLYDLVGNVAEWVLAPSGPMIVGGSFLTSGDRAMARETDRSAAPGYSVPDVGFRCASDPFDLLERRLFRSASAQSAKVKALRNLLVRGGGLARSTLQRYAELHPEHAALVREASASAPR